jgi:hypothetical protein
MTNLAKIEERKAEHEVINRVRAIRRKIQKEQAGMTDHEKTVETHNSVVNFLRENGYTLKYADGHIEPQQQSAQA